MILCRCIVKILFFVYIVIINIQVIESIDVCKGADITLIKFWDKLNNIKHGDILFINIKNYYCPACSRYVDIWKMVESDVLNFEKKVTMFVFDCSCHLFISYCRFFEVYYFPTFRLLFPVYDKIENNNEYKYIYPSESIISTRYKGDLILAYREVERVNNIIEFQQLMQTHLCKNVNFNNVDLKSCYSDLSEIGTQDAHPIFSGNSDDITDATKERLAVDRWKMNNNNKKDMKHDIIKGLLFTLKKHISMGSDINRETVEPYLVMLEIVSNVYTDLKQSLNEISKKLKNFNYPMNYEDWSNAIHKSEDIKIDIYKMYNDKDSDHNNDSDGDMDKHSLNFKICEENSVLCTYWLLYHKISIHCLLHDKEKYNYYLEAITNYTKSYLNCENCIQHFLNAQKSCYYGFCNIHSAESVVIFLWRIHNSVTLRSMYEHIILDARFERTNNSNKQKYVNKDIAFPSERQCKYCRSGIGFTRITSDLINKLLKQKSFSDQDFDAIDAFHIKHVLSYLVRIYS
ncbi:sulfhydryl oxidase [Plasmodium brasilianum]|uniref:Sulfhydryl oxidase n=2 Tax=Plasmodium (Plasmodium) TaxID=418103 RepID=A0A1A8WJ70_PLAMA|nr:conserved Plasmodium protein, unknown function [Plasmodium malariae]KAI4835115.1 sulfhydryl oxidase [Plasmodium brasilianum]SBS91301.1 conserved Plasmodium protein, unknown function [Plasmodium malariae]SCP03692.1 conserved Plasmodium protein, unknown function [Plasmodium malariae]